MERRHRGLCNEASVERLESRDCLCIEVEDAFERNDGEDSAVFDETTNIGVCDRVLRRNRSDSAVGVERSTLWRQKLQGVLLRIRHGSFHTRQRKWESNTGRDRFADQLKLRWQNIVV